MNLAQKYRPETFEDLVGQEGPVRALRNLLSKPVNQQSYIFTGSRGTGKTTTARIFGKALNCKNGPSPVLCGDCPSCRKKAVDIEEMDAASSSSISHVRELKTKIYTRPLLGRYRIFILDEVHMFSDQAFDVLLKTLEEPPKHAIFIMATTEIQEVPSTIQSRSQVYNFGLLPVDLTYNRLRWICSAENLVVSDESLMLIAQQGEGSLRDAITLLSRFVEDTSDEFIRSQLGLLPASVLNNLVLEVAAGNHGKVFDILDSNSGTDWATNWNEFVKLFGKHVESKWNTSEFSTLSEKLVRFKLRTYDVMQSSCPQAVLGLLLVS
jgi:DNA polymerase-3 subunit gamma/tau